MGPVGVRNRDGSVRGLAFSVLLIAALLVPAVYLATQAGAPEQVTGFVLDVRSRPPLEVESFDLVTADGSRLTFEVGDLDVSSGFAAGHLLAHQIGLELVIVTYQRDGDRLVAIRFDDGPVPSFTSPAP